jgi:hypothetical protein
VRPEGFCQLKISVAPSGIEPATLRWFVAQCLNHYATAYPRNAVVFKITCMRIDVSGVTVTQFGPRGYIATDQILVMGCPFVLFIETNSIIQYTVTSDYLGYKATGLACDEAHTINARTHIRA